MAGALAEEPAEVIVVEDGTAGVDDAVLQGARLVRTPHVRRSRARNLGVEQARTPLVAFLDEDDACLPGRLARQQEALERAPAATMTFGLVRLVDRAGATLEGDTRALERRYAELAAQPTYHTVLRLGGPLYTSATMVRRDAFLASGGFDSAFDAYEDLDLYLRLARERHLVPTPGPPVTLYRLHGANTPSDDLYRGLLAVTAKHLPAADPAARRLIFEKRVDALWALRRYAEARAEAGRALRELPVLLLRPLFLKRLAGLAVPDRILSARP